MSLNARPFLKWAGGKFKLCPWLKLHLPEGKRLIEPFVGAAALFLNTDFKKAILNDCNPDLITLYQTLQSEGETFIAYCRSFFTPKNNTSKQYYRLRQRFNSIDDPREKSALFLYLNRHGYNGLCRYSQRNGFNVPMGHYSKPYFPEIEMRIFHDRAQNAIFTCEDFSLCLQKAKPGDVVYCDPPYYPLNDSAYFTAYHHKGFSMQQQKTLAQGCEALQRKGIVCLVSNHDLEETQTLYQQASRLVFNEVRRNISAKISDRKLAKELLAIYE